MNEVIPADRLAHYVQDWEPDTVATSRRVDSWHSAAFSGLIGAEPPGLSDGDPLPPLWHWFTIVDHPPQADIGEDGHPEHGPLLPPIPDRRRMFAGGRFTQLAPIHFGDMLSCRSSVIETQIKSGRTGAMFFVTVRNELSVGGAFSAVEEQDIVYRSEPANRPRQTLARPAETQPDPSGQWRRGLRTDPVLLARFSALTYNGHRIHYDRSYATDVEGYPDLVVHGPLLALLALELPRNHAPDATVRKFSYRLTRPAFCPARVIATATRSGDQVSIAVGAAGTEPSLSALAHLDR
jgi:3-methylfumaryl-CoA hydratase